ncbi:aldose 1-epimerase family protein [Xanthomonas hortorum]|uniref:Aldose 1-epimerase family protein n=1 Tax=Xanthomonas hortorum TaxID=56454 RepID=A0AA47IDN5_9XANT|nr:aldose 1-epimerase family protein [Xanthomonas hortorum]
MITVRSLVVGCIVAAALPAHAMDYALISPDKPIQEWSISNDQLGIHDGPPFKVSLRRLSGGRQEGSALIEIDTGAMQLTVVPTRGMNVLRAQVGDLRLGWDSPVSEVVNPAFVNLESRGGLGWLEGFNELVARCGFEWLGHPGEDRGELLTLHGRASYLPAHTVVLSIDERAPHRISLKGVLNEQAFKKVDFRIDTELTTEPGATAFTLHDRLTNQSDQPGEYQVLYHSNFGAPLLEEGARFAIPVREVSPFNARAQQELSSWQTFRGPAAGYGETVYNVYPIGDGTGQSLAVLHDKSAQRGIALAFNVKQLPVFSLWKNTDSQTTGYVAGLEPGTSFSYNRSLQRDLGLVPTIEAGGTRDFILHYRLLPSAAAVRTALHDIATLQNGHPPKVRQTPLAQEH